MKSFKSLAVFAAAALVLVSCGKSTRISGVLEGAADRQVVVKLLDVNTFTVLDTLKTSASGEFSCKVDVQEGQPEFIYLFYGDTKVASLLLERGDRVSVKVDTLGNYSIEGSEESVRLQEVEQRFAAFASAMTGLAEEYDDPSLTKSQREAVNSEITRLFIKHYREDVRYITANSKSLTCIPVLYESLNEYSPVFNQPTDALHFRSVCDSLKTVYPESRYVKALDKEATRRENMLQLGLRIDQAEPVGFPDVVMPDMKGVKTSLSAVSSKVVMLHFWDAADAEQKMLNLDVLLPVYEQFHSRGFEIYSVCLTPDKGQWASVVKAQKLPWINVNDGLGAASTAVRTYNVTNLPTSILIVDGAVYPTSIKGADGLRRELGKLLK